MLHLSPMSISMASAPWWCAWSILSVEVGDVDEFGMMLDLCLSVVDGSKVRSVKWKETQGGKV